MTVVAELLERLEGAVEASPRNAGSCPGHAELDQGSERVQVLLSLERGVAGGRTAARLHRYADAVGVAAGLIDAAPEMVE